MKKFKQLFEELSKEQSAKISSIASQRPTPEVFAHLPEELKKSDTIYHPFDSSAHSASIHPGVAAHLEKHGYKIASPHDYVAGYATDKHARQVSIGKALNKTEAPSEIKSAFENDPGRSLAKKSKMLIAYTHNPHHVAGMSTDRGWTSCMDMNSGCNAHYIPEDIVHGTHVAYLIHAHDKDIKNPIARIALKPFRSWDSGHVVLRPEDTAYGTSNDKFAAQVHEFAKTHFPARDNETYLKNSNLYHDSSSASAKFSTHSDLLVDHLLKEYTDNPLDARPIREIELPRLLRGISRLPEKSEARKSVNDFVAQNRADNAEGQTHVAREWMSGNADDMTLRRSDFVHINDPEVVNHLAKHDFSHTGGASHIASSLLQNHLLKPEHQARLIKGPLESDFSFLEGSDHIKNPSPEVIDMMHKHIKRKIESGRLFNRTDDKVINHLVASEHFNPIKARSIVDHMASTMPSNEFGASQRRLISYLQKNPSYTLQHAKHLDKGVEEHGTGTIDGVFAIAHKDAGEKELNELSEKNGIERPLDHDTIHHLRMVRNNYVPNKVFDLAYKHSSHPMEFIGSGVVDSDGSTGRTSKAAREIEALAKNHAALASYDYANPVHPHEGVASAIARKTIEEIKDGNMGPRHVKGILANATHHGLKDVASAALNHLSGKYDVEQHHIDKFVSKFPDLAHGVHEKIGSGELSIAKH